MFKKLVAVAVLCGTSSIFAFTPPPVESAGPGIPAAPGASTATVSQAPVASDPNANMNLQQSTRRNLAEDDTAPLVTDMPGVRPEVNVDNQPLSQRLRRIEAQMDYWNQQELQQRLDSLQQVVQLLRGQLEVQTHQLDELKQQQRTLYVDLDNRLARLSTQSAVTAESQSGAGELSSQDPKQLAKIQAAYEAAYKRLTEKRYDQALSAFQVFVKEFPRSTYVANAHYWIGEIYTLQNNKAAAEKSFSTVIKDFPKHRKVPDAMLKLAFIRFDEGKKDLAKADLVKLVKRYPKTPAARIADERLQMIKRFN